MICCPHCQSCVGQNKAGFTKYRSQRYFCCACSRTYTPPVKPRGYSPSVRQEAVRYSLEGISQRKTARLLKVSPQSVANWLAQAGKRLEELQAQGQMPEVPAELVARAEGVMEQDEVFTFCNAKRLTKDKTTGEKKTNVTRPASST